MAEEKAIVDQPHSCKIAVNAKQQFSGEVKVYASDSSDALSVAMDHANELAEWIKKKNG